MRRKTTIEQIEERIKLLIENFSGYVEEFNRRNLFTGPSVYFHNKTLEILRRHSKPSKALSDDLFFDYLYATLASWGLHRMGQIPTKLLDLDEIKESFRSMKLQIFRLEDFKITNIPKGKLENVISKLWEILSNVKVSGSNTRLVANSKALHHIIPDLMPPIDRQYTLKFFNYTDLKRDKEEAIFREIYRYFHKIAFSCKDKIKSHIGVGMNTSQTKVIDNAIIGFVLEELNKKDNF